MGATSKGTKGASNGRGNPRWRFDRQRMREAGALSLAGVDEAGRGALAGPVVAAAAFLRASTYEAAAFRRDSRAINDSKQLTATAREAHFAAIESWRKEELLVVQTGLASVDEISRHNILGATRLAMRRALEALAVELCPADAGDGDWFAGGATDCQYPLLLVDGLRLKSFPWRHEGVVGGDGKSLAIGMASIVAKVTRDRLMTELHAEDPRYGYDRHKGYGAPKHLTALRELGPSRHHREKFLRKLDLGRSIDAQAELF